VLGYRRGGELRTERPPQASMSGSRRRVRSGVSSVPRGVAHHVRDPRLERAIEDARNGFQSSARSFRPFVLSVAQHHKCLRRHKPERRVTKHACWGFGPRLAAGALKNQPTHALRARIQFGKLGWLGVFNAEPVPRSADGRWKTRRLPSRRHLALRVRSVVGRLELRRPRCWRQTSSATVATVLDAQLAVPIAIWV